MTHAVFPFLIKLFWQTHFKGNNATTYILTVPTHPHTYDTNNFKKRGVVCSNICSGIWESEERWKTWFGSLPPVFASKFWRHGSKSSWEVSQDLLGLQAGVPCKLWAWPLGICVPPWSAVSQSARHLKPSAVSTAGARTCPDHTSDASVLAITGFPPLHVDQSLHKLSNLKWQQLSSQRPQHTVSNKKIT